MLRDVCCQWRQQSQLLTDSDFALVEPILAARSVAQQTLMSRVADPDGALSSVLTDHLMELCGLARRAGNTQVRRALRHLPHKHDAVVLTALRLPYSWRSVPSFR